MGPDSTGIITVVFLSLNPDNNSRHHVVDPIFILSIGKKYLSLSLYGITICDCFRVDTLKIYSYGRESIYIIIIIIIIFITTIKGSVPV